MLRGETTVILANFVIFVFEVKILSVLLCLIFNAVFLVKNTTGYFKKILALTKNDLKIYI